VICRSDLMLNNRCQKGRVRRLLGILIARPLPASLLGQTLDNAGLAFDGRVLDLLAASVLINDPLRYDPPRQNGGDNQTQEPLSDQLGDDLRGRVHQVTSYRYEATWDSPSRPQPWSRTAWGVESVGRLLGAWGVESVGKSVSASAWESPEEELVSALA
jgi:hypothetical protein